MIGKAIFSGKLKSKRIPCPKSPLFWRLKNWTRWGFILGLASTWLAHGFTKLTGSPVLTSQLSCKLTTPEGKVIDYGVVSLRVVTTAFVNYMVDELIAETSAWGDFKFHDSGIGTTGAAVGDTDIETTDQESRVSGTQAEDAANIYESVATIAYTNTLAITEHGLFNIVTGGILMDRHVFAAINVVNGSSIEHTYKLTVTAGG